MSKPNETRYRISLEDKGQDLLYFITDANGFVLEAHPFHSKLYEGAYLPLDSLVIGEPCMIHHPPKIEFGVLNYNVEAMYMLNKKHYGEIEIALLPEYIEDFENNARVISESFEIKYQYTNDGARNYLVQTDNIVELLVISDLVRKFEKKQFNS